ncbi:hypothetical protein CBR_g24106 [Chara braunii]|uniref:Myb/SANT-like DNA-binding domain-containing protein n=1 Tax=Chara braunii TaxID=69332 RepID=A0A388L5W2_CHABU|nr:hypothetical protein CBR_g24106 [Chara braunii]|eukprot:GBG77658.1 hypothetical protein CBR_g24106 [Chara braunii]
MNAIIRAKWDEEAHMQGMGHACAHMKTREWKWADVEERLKKVGVERTTDKCGKKWDNLMQQFKKVHLFQGESGKQDFFQLTGKERSTHGFNFTMDRAVYEEIKGSTAKNHTINPKHVANTGGSGGVQLSSGFAGSPQSVGDGDTGGDDNDEEDNSTKGSSPTMGSSAGFGKRKNVRQQTFEALTECREKHRTLMATTMGSAGKRQCSIQLRQCEAMEAEVEVQRKHYAALDSVTKLMCQALLEIAKAIRHPIAHFTPSSLSVIVLVVFTMSSHGGNRGKKRDSLEAEAPAAVKKGRHQPKNKKVVAEGLSRGSATRDDEWVRDFKGAGGGGRKADVVIDVDAGQAAREVLLDAAPQTAPAGGAVARTRVTAPPDAQDSAWVQSPPTTPRGQAIPEKGGAAKVVVQGSGHDTHRQDPIASQGGVVAGSSRLTAVAATAESRGRRGEGDADEPLVNRQRWGNARDGIEAATKLWVDDMRFWNETEGNGLFKVIQEARLYLLAIAKGVATHEIHRSIALPHSSIPQHKIEDESQPKAVKDRATKVQSIVLRVIHGWIFKSASRSWGYHSTYGYVLNHVVTDMARVMWLGED